MGAFEYIGDLNFVSIQHYAFSCGRNLVARCHSDLAIDRRHLEVHRHTDFYLAGFLEDRGGKEFDDITCVGLHFCIWVRSYLHVRNFARVHNGSRDD